MMTISHPLKKKRKRRRRSRSYPARQTINGEGR